MMENESSAIVRSPEDIIKQFQAYLRKYENDDKLVILEAVEKSGSKLGDNYLSDMIKTKLVGTCGDGSPYTKSFMTKIIRNSKLCLNFDLPSMFRTEVHVYLEVLPILGSFGPRCVHGDKDTIIMEDLTEKGYITYEKLNFLDLNHTIFTLKKLAKFHASALTVKITNPRQFDTLCLHLEEALYKYNSESSFMKTLFDVFMKMALQYLDVIEPQTQELQTIKDHVATCSDKMYDAYYRLFNAPKQKYDTLCHGDPWINNLLFLHNKDDRIIDLKMVDYQIVRYSSIAVDILYFIYSSVQSSLIEKSFESLIKIYHNAFLNELRQSHVDEKILEELGMEWLEKELRTYALIGLNHGCIFLHLILVEEKDAQQFNEFDLNQWNLEVDMNSAIAQKKLDRIKCFVFHYYRRLHLGIINEDIEPIPIRELY